MVLPDLSWLFIVLAQIPSWLDAPGLAFSAFLALLLASAVLGQEPVMNGRVVGVTDADSLKNFVAVQRTRTGRFPSPGETKPAAQAGSEILLWR
jgi:hypothetical protein